ncbi:MAG: hypothetical protein WBA89_01165 [Microcoleus sp.]|uniref:hypothetical protein n=1 Tax=Microcoleus sp. TaxID=44472 RepID=UPI003C7149C8
MTNQDLPESLKINKPGFYGYHRSLRGICVKKPGFCLHSSVGWAIDKRGIPNTFYRTAECL